jgi:hypothetical protein
MSMGFGCSVCILQSHVELSGKPPRDLIDLVLLAGRISNKKLHTERMIASRFEPEVAALPFRTRGNYFPFLLIWLKASIIYSVSHHHGL